MDIAEIRANFDLPDSSKHVSYCTGEREGHNEIVTAPEAFEWPHLDVSPRDIKSPAAEAA